ncbi:hypothetical protein J437_LFUL018866 [Ladona fulva]|uniref:Uncharacterized protein n=1 Tax=Ladona fulva TaxID=123851 RepID=A0A8K0PD56_LADFU|nr:hypothetical protein J437_LFUL018866 [Ladona fulva]
MAPISIQEMEDAIFYCHDIPRPKDKTTQLVQFANDTAAWATAINPTRAKTLLQHYTISLEGWMKHWRLRPNPNKSSFLIFTDKRP